MKCCCVVPYTLYYWVVTCHSETFLNYWFQEGGAVIHCHENLLTKYWAVSNSITINVQTSVTPRAAATALEKKQ